MEKLKHAYQRERRKR